MNQRTFLAIVMIAGITHSVAAQQDTAKKYVQMEQLFKVMNMEQRCLQSANTSADQTIGNTPKLVGKEKEVKAFFLKYTGFSACKAALTNLYTKYYTSEEIDDLIALWKTSDIKKFNKTATGKKEPVMSKKIETESKEIFTENVQAHIDELNKLASP